MGKALEQLEAWAPPEAVREARTALAGLRAELLPLALASGAALTSTSQAQQEQQAQQPPSAQPTSAQPLSQAASVLPNLPPAHRLPTTNPPVEAAQPPQPANPLAACEAPTQPQAATAAPAAASEAPAAAASPSAERCSLCGQAATAPVRCGRCGTTYCGRRCQVQHFREGHLKECTAIVKARVAARLAASPYGGSDSGSATAGGASGSS